MDEAEKELYVKGFNNGFTLAQAGEKLPDVEPSDKEAARSYLDGLADGWREFERRKARDLTAQKTDAEPSRDRDSPNDKQEIDHDRQQ